MKTRGEKFLLVSGAAAVPLLVPPAHLDSSSHPAAALELNQIVGSTNAVSY